MTTEGHDASPRAIRETLGPDVQHRTSRYLNSRLEQDHRGLKQRSYPLRGFGSFASADRFCTVFGLVNASGDSQPLARHYQDARHQGVGRLAG